jgi:hypothetical protein
VSSSWPLPNDPLPVTAVALACVCALQGDGSSSAEWEKTAISSAENIGFPRGPFSLAFVATYLAWLRMIIGEVDEARRLGRWTLDLAEQHRFDYFRAIGYQYVLVPDDQVSASPEELAGSEAAMDMIGHAAFRPAFHGIVARNHLVRGELEQAVIEVSKGLNRVERSGERVHEPYLLILRAEIATRLRNDASHQALSDLRAALELAKSQGSLILALRAANEIGRLPGGVRPTDWADLVRTTAGLLPASSQCAELAKARELLSS